MGEQRQPIGYRARVRSETLVEGPVRRGVGVWRGIVFAGLADVGFTCAGLGLGI